MLRAAAASAADRLRGGAVMLALGIAALAVLSFALIAAVGLLIAALFLHLAASMEPAAAALLTGLAVLVVAGAAIALIWPRRAAPKPAAPGSVDPARAAGADLARWVSDRPIEAAAAALAIGFVLGASPAARRAARAAAELIQPPR